MSHPGAGRSGCKGHTAVLYARIDLFGHASLHSVGKHLRVSDSMLIPSLHLDCPVPQADKSMVHSTIKGPLLPRLVTTTQVVLTNHVAANCSEQGHIGTNGENVLVDLAGDITHKPPILYHFLPGTYLNYLILF